MLFHSVERLGSPFHSVSEVGVIVPRTGEMVWDNSEYKLLFILEANCAMTIPGAGGFAVRKGDVYVLPRRCEQHYRLESKLQSSRVHALKIAFNLPPLPPSGREMAVRRSRADPEADLAAFVRHHFREIRHLPAAQDAAMLETMREIRFEAEQHRPGIRHRVRALCTSLLVHTARRLHDAPANKSADSRAHVYAVIVNQTKEFLLRNLARDITLGEIAWHVKKSDEHLARVFRKVTGQTVFAYLRTVRLESAKTMLIDSDKSMTDIARHAGFSSLALFSRNFSQYVGQSASVYRAERAAISTPRTIAAPVRDLNQLK